jgi:hypothetical protein
MATNKAERNGNGQQERGPIIDGKTGEILNPPGEGELVEGAMAVSLARAEIAEQVATARKFPRSLTKASERMASLATMDEETAEECIYALPRGGKPIRGPSIRFAEMVFQSLGQLSRRGRGHRRRP